MSSDYDNHLSHHSSKYRRNSPSRRKRYRSSSSSSNESRNHHRYNRSPSPRRHHSSSASNNNSQSSRQKSPIKSSRQKHRQKQERSPSKPLTPPPTSKISTVPSSFKTDVKVHQYDLSQVANNSLDIDGKYFETDEFFIKPFESRKSSKIVYNLDTQTILLPDKVKCELSSPIECSLSKQLFEVDEVRWRRWNDFAHNEWKRLYKEHPDLYSTNKTFFS